MIQVVVAANMAENKVPKTTEDAVLVHSSTLPEYSVEVQGFDWSQGIDYEALLNSYATSGYQATNYGHSVTELNKMVLCYSNSIIFQFIIFIAFHNSHWKFY